MADLIERAKNHIDALIKAAVPALEEASGSVSIPKNTQNGDFAANHAMAGAKALPGFDSAAPHQRRSAFVSVVGSCW